jgi:SAM-dependent methyltransferase
VSAAEAGRRPSAELRRRYTAADLDVLTAEEARRFLGSGARDPRLDWGLAWELVYRLEPMLYDRLCSAERLHPGVIEWLPAGVDRVVEVGAGTGRLTLELLDRARELVAIEPAAPLREILARRLERRGGCLAQARAGFFDDLPVPDDWADLVVACSAFTPEDRHGGEAGLTEMERVCRPGGLVALIWPNNLDWLASRGYSYLSFPGQMFVEFGSPEEAAELVEIFYPEAAEEVRRGELRRVPYEALGINAPRDVAFKEVGA